MKRDGTNLPCKCHSRKRTKKDKTWHFSHFKFRLKNLITATQMKRCFILLILLFCSDWVTFAWKTVCEWLSNRLMLTHASYFYIFHIWLKSWIVPLISLGMDFCFMYMNTYPMILVCIARRYSLCCRNVVL